MELVSYDVHANSEDFMDIEAAVLKLHDKIQEFLKPQEKRVYKMLYIEHKSEKEVGKEMGYITNEKNRDPGYRQIKNIKKSIIEKSKKLIYEGGLDLY
jgi:DNA-directed RNA polymerase specialized sigma subunit